MDPEILPPAPESVTPPAPKFKWGERAARARRLKSRYPEMTTADIARRVGATPDAVSQVLKRFLGNHSESDLRGFQQAKADVYDAIQRRCLDSVTDQKLRKTSVSAAVMSAAILEDKARLVRGQATAINVTALLDVAELIRNKDG